MDSPRHSCTDCHNPLPAGVESGLCEICSGTPVSADTISSPAHRFAEDASSRSMHLSDLPIPGGFSTTGHFPDQRDDAPTADPPSHPPIPLPPHPPGYELLDEISRGGMGVVYLARSRSRKDLYVAAKYLIDPTSLSAFRRFVVEVESSPLKSDHVVSVVGGDTTANPPYFFMEVAGGGTLARLVKKGGPLDPALAARWMKAIAGAVAEVHDRGVIHRDIKPGNILLKRTDGRDAEFVRLKGAPKGDEPPFDPADFVPKLSDFGLAKRLDATHGLTVGSAVMGTLQYMPPEQLRNPQGGDADFRVGERSDVYSLGATLYHLVCGRPPFDHESQLALMDAVARKDPPLPSTVRKDCPPKLEAIIVKAMEKIPRNRYQSAAELATELERFVKDPESVQAPEMTRLRRAWRAVCRRQKAIAACAVVACAVAAGAMIPKPVSAPVTPTPPDAADQMRKELDEVGRVEALAPDGMPRYYRPHLAPATPGNSAVGRSCLFQAYGDGMLELIPDLGKDRYRVSLQLLHSDVRPGGPSDPTEREYVGFYFGHAVTQLPSGELLHTLSAVSYSDIDAKAAIEKRVVRAQTAYVRNIVFHQMPDHTVRAVRVKVASVPFTPPSPFVPGKWRPVVIDVSPEEVRVQWLGDDDKMRDLMRWPREKFDRLYDALRADATRAFPDLLGSLPRWSPRMPLGLVAFKSAVVVKDLTIETQP